MAAPDDFPGEPAADPAWSDLPTEARHRRASEELDRLSGEEIVELLLAEDRRGIERALAERGAIARAAGWVAEALAGGVVLFAGAGTSGRLGVLEAAECPPTFGTALEAIRAVMAGGPEAVFHAREGAEDSEEEGRAAAAAGSEVKTAIVMARCDLPAAAARERLAAAGGHVRRALEEG